MTDGDARAGADAGSDANAGGDANAGVTADAGGGNTPNGDGNGNALGRDGDGAHPLDELVDRPAASAGLVAAGVALAAAFLPWTDAPAFVPTVAETSSPVAAAFAALAATVFLVRRYGGLGRRTGAVTAGAASAGVLLTALARFLAPATGGGADPSVGLGLPLAGVGGSLALAFAVADARETSASTLVEMARRTAAGFGLLVGAFAVLYVVAAPLAVVEFDPMTRIAVSVVLTDLVFAAVALAFLLGTRRGLGFVDVVVPDVRDLVYVGVGIVALFVALFALRLATLGLDLPATSNNITDAAMEGHPETLLVLVVLSFLLVAPAEELLNRNVIQKYLYGAFSRPAAVVVASGIFAVAHVFSYSGDSVVGMFVSLLSIFLLSMVLGAIYERTENIVVPVFVHGFFNAVQFTLLYVAIVYGDVAEQIATALPW